MFMGAISVGCRERIDGMGVRCNTVVVESDGEDEREQDGWLGSRPSQARALATRTFGVPCHVTRLVHMVPRVICALDARLCPAFVDSHGLKRK